MDDLFGNLIKIELPNRLKIWFKKREKENLISLRLVIMTAGSAYQDIKDLGLAHFVEHLVFNFTSESNSKKQLYEEIVEKGGYLNALTCLSHTIVTAEIPPQKIDVCLELIQKCFSSPDFSDKDIKNERKVILNELQNDQNDFWFWIYRNIFGKHPVTYNGIGNLRTIKKINREKIEKFFHNNYVANKIVLVCVGNTELEELKSRVETKLSGLRNNSGKIETYPFPEVKNKTVKINSLFAKRTFFYGFKVCGYLNEPRDYFVLWIIRDYLHKVLFDFIRQKGLVYEIYVNYYPFNAAGMFSFYVPYMKKGLRQLRKKVEEEIAGLKNKLVPGEELERMKSFTANQFMNFLSDRKELADYYVSLTESPAGIEEFKNPIEEINSVTSLKLRETSNNYFNKEHLFVLVNPELRDALVFIIILIVVPAIIHFLLSRF